MIVVDPGFFAEIEPGFSRENVRIREVHDHEAAAAALERAGARMMAVTEFGFERGRGADEPAQPGVDHEDVYTPNWHSDVKHSDKGPWMYIDCKSCIPPPMREAFIRILTEELTDEGITTAKLESPMDEEVSL